MCVYGCIHGNRAWGVCVYLQWGEDAGGDDDEEPEVHEEELADHVGHVGWEDQQEQAQAHGPEVLPQAPEQSNHQHTY